MSIMIFRAKMKKTVSIITNFQTLLLTKLKKLLSVEFFFPKMN